MDTYSRRELNTGPFDRFRTRQAYGLSFYLSVSLPDNRSNELRAISDVISGNMGCNKGAERDADSMGLVNYVGAI